MRGENRDILRFCRRMDMNVSLRPVGQSGES